MYIASQSETMQFQNKTRFKFVQMQSVQNLTAVRPGQSSSTIRVQVQTPILNLTCAKYEN